MGFIKFCEHLQRIVFDLPGGFSGVFQVRSDVFLLHVVEQLNGKLGN